ncbi:histidinol-phosphate transaminase [Psychrobacter sp. FDAARGOS_221]|uniref:histidinol-phosphate transaminase n=1 Tax=Psychrobacter sp. FDAARGOS_221 TaxID=1975705 RepID=UPI000BB59240|nr:histidinol-phosphate transaminase [Psychrobacter sp. FDAARGOS_221]PNK59530.1 histidinol-phosphate transaminase [Psychrobacter sp. FDAARGOS_221]
MSHKTFSTPAYDSINELHVYQAGKSVDELKREYEVNDVLKLASNENALGSSPKVTLAITEQLGKLARYPDCQAEDLKLAIAQFADKKRSQVTLGNGATDLLTVIARSFVAQDDAVIYSEYAFFLYARLAKIVGAESVVVPAKRYGHDLDAMLEAVEQAPNTRMVFIANPNNPTGTLLTQQQIHDFVSKLPAHVLVVLDEAYVEYCPESDNSALLDEFDNVIIVRTFSKAYGLAGLRVGYALSHPDVAAVLNRTRQPFSVSSVAQAAAIAALDDQDFIAKVHKINDGQMRWICKQFDALGLDFVPSHASFVMVNVASVGDADEIYEGLLQQGVIVRSLRSYGLEGWLRMTVGTPEDNTRLIDTLRDILESL